MSDDFEFTNGDLNGDDENPSLLNDAAFNLSLIHI